MYCCLRFFALISIPFIRHTCLGAIIAFCCACASVVVLGSRLPLLAVHFPVLDLRKSCAGKLFSVGCYSFFLLYIGVGGVCWYPLSSPSPAWHYVVTDFNCIPWKGCTHTQIITHTCTFVSHVQHLQFC